VVETGDMTLVPLSWMNMKIKLDLNQDQKQSTKPKHFSPRADTFNNSSSSSTKSNYLKNNTE
jgi:hypothetical protein